MAHNGHLLLDICQDEETLDHAKVILLEARSKTNQGSGYYLGPRSVGLPAICALIASQRLNNGLVTTKAAQIASCLNKAEFQKAFDIVQNVLGGTKEDIKTRVPETATYESLRRKYGILISLERLVPILHETANKLNSSRSRYKPNSAVVRCALFFWTFHDFKKDTFEAPQEYAEENGVSPKILVEILGYLTKNLSPMRQQILEEMKKGASSIRVTPRVSPAKRSPNKHPLRELPSKDTPKKSTIKTTQPEIDSCDIDMLTPQTPSKKRKLDSVSELATPDFLERPTPSKSHVAPGKPRHPKTVDNDSFVSVPLTPRRSVRIYPHSLNIMDIDVDMHVAGAVERTASSASSTSSEEDDDIPGHRFRPVFSDHAQWYSRDPRLARIWKQSSKHFKAMEDTHGRLFSMLPRPNGPSE